MDTLWNNENRITIWEYLIQKINSSDGNPEARYILKCLKKEMSIK